MVSLKHILLIVFICIFAFYVTGFISWWVFLRASDILGYRFGYTPLLIGLISLILLLSEIVLYTLAFRWFVIQEIKSLSPFDLRRFAKSFITLSTPILVLSIPMIVIGVCGIIAEHVFYNAVVFATLYWGAALAIYSLFIHFLYAPCCALAIGIYIDVAGESSISIAKALKKSLRTILYLFVVSIIVWLTTSIATAIIISVAPVLSEPIVPLQQPPPHALWAGTWYNIALNAMPRYYNLLMNPISYIIYTLIFRYLARETLDKIFAIETTHRTTTQPKSIPNPSI